jgi:primosomal protein N' (replication factor Y) (superfamily II helicase)
LTVFVEVYVEHKIYTYAVPEGLTVTVGQEVLVPLRKKEKDGYVIRLVEKPTFKTLPVISIVNATRHFDEQLVTLAYWISDYYKCFPKTAIKAILPR